MNEPKKCCDCECELTKDNTSYVDFVCDDCYEAEQDENEHYSDDDK